MTNINTGIVSVSLCDHVLVVLIHYTVHGKVLAGGKFWQTVQVKAIGEEKFGK